MGVRENPRTLVFQTALRYGASTMRNFYRLVETVKAKSPMRDGATH